MSIFLLKFKGEEERNLRHFYDFREGKLIGLISSKLFQEIQNVVVTATPTDNSAINSGAPDENIVLLYKLQCFTRISTTAKCGILTHVKIRYFYM